MRATHGASELNGKQIGCECTYVCMHICMYGDNGYV